MTSKTRHSHRVRCGSCRTRYRIKRHPDDYVRRPRCGCGGNLNSIEAERRRELAKQERCTCMAIPFPHRAGSLRFCELHPRSEIEPTDEEWQDFEYLLATPRSG